MFMFLFYLKYFSENCVKEVEKFLFCLIWYFSLRFFFGFRLNFSFIISLCVWVSDGLAYCNYSDLVQQRSFKVRQRWWRWRWLPVLLMVFRWQRDWMMVVIWEMLRCTSNKSRPCLRISREARMRLQGCQLRQDLMFSSILVFCMFIFLCYSFELCLVMCVELM